MAPTVPKGDTGDREIEASIHQRQHDAQRQQHAPLGPGCADQEAPGPTPQRKDHGGAGDAEPRHSKYRDAGEEEHREGRPKIVEDGTAVVDGGEFELLS